MELKVYLITAEPGERVIAARLTFASAEAIAKLDPSYKVKLLSASKSTELGKRDRLIERPVTSILEGEASCQSQPSVSV